MLSKHTHRHSFTHFWILKKFQRLLSFLGESIGIFKPRASTTKLHFQSPLFLQKTHAKALNVL
jgi:hypothetical protein